MKMTAVVIDDMPDAMELMVQDIDRYCPFLDLIGTADSVVTGAKLIKRIMPDLIFLDIELGDGTGFDILDLIDPFYAQVIFTTASNAYAIKAFRYAAVDYLLKPVDADLLKEAVGRVRSKLNANYSHLQLAANVYKNEGHSDTIALHTFDEIKMVSISQIIRCEASDNYTLFYLEDKTKTLISKTLKYFDGILSEHDFLRVHQSHLINPRHIQKLSRKDGGYLSMSDGSNVPISVRKKSMVMDFLK